ncbi:hypothetical protein C8Q74DRAFT_137813 [Fomes fomentarius]|nr:hypothetical protein C8Q74DRAFT_137813 [Fomes fomentarius]
MSIPPPMSLSQSLPTSVPSSSAPSSSAPSSVALPPAAFTALPPSSIHTVLSDSSALVLDIRPHNVYVQARIPNALSLSVPSTLLKRPNFPLARLAEMLPTSFARDKLSKWPQASRILVYDSDSASLPPNLTSSNLLGLMRKFRSEGYPAAREIAWLRGGFHAVSRDYPDLVDRSPPSDELDEDEEQGEPEIDGNPALLAKTASASGTSRVLRAKHLPQAAFTSATTISLRRKAMQPPPTIPLQVVPPTPGIQLDDPLSKLPDTSTSVAAVPPPIVKASRSGRAEFTLSLPPGLVKARTMPGTTSGPMVSMPTLSPQYTHPGAYNRVASYSVPGRQVAFNPFFDTIRQNIELGNKSAATEGIPLKLPRRVRRRVGELPFEWLREIARKSRRSTESSSSISEASGSSSDSDGHHGDGNDSLSFAGPSTIEQDSTSTSRTLQRPSQSQLSMTAHRSPHSSPSSQPIPIQVSRPRFGSDSPPSPTSSSHSQTPPEAHELTRALEMQFYKIELGEQKRLLGVMERHSMESGKVIHEGSGVHGSLGLGLSNPSPREARGSLPLSSAEDSKAAIFTAEEAMQPFPYSITAGLEKGAKNRYRNIWPFEHARVRLCRSKPDDDDYMNASFVQPLGTTKRYIATQGPLPTTFTDFWTLCWEQNVHVIVMLTREIEGSSVKCGKYWAEGTYGPLRLRLIETSDTPERERKRQESETSGGFFSAHMQAQAKAKPKPKSKGRGKGKAEDASMEDEENPSSIKRVFELTNTAYPLAPPRIVTQFQYLEWPDLNVPKDPRGVLGLMRQVEEAVEHNRSFGQKQWGEGPLYLTGHVDAEPIHGSTIVTGKGRISDEVDPITGVALVARENAPVLLHCSAGVGRTGGFIAVDAVLDGVRREMRKRKAQQTADATATSELEGRFDAACRSNSRSRSRSMSIVSEMIEPMEVDPSPSPRGPKAEETDAALIMTMPVSAGDREVHVPVAGFTDTDTHTKTQTQPMDVDDHHRDSAVLPSTPSSSLKPVPISPPLLQASPELVEEVRRASLNALSGMSPRTPKPEYESQPQPPLMEPRAQRASNSSSVGASESSSDSYAARSSTRSVSTLRTRTSLSASPPTSLSHTDSSTSAMVGQTAKMSMASPSPPPSDNVPLPPTGTGPNASSSCAHCSAKRPSMSAQSHRLNTWRSEVHSSASAEFVCRLGEGAPSALPTASKPHTTSDSKDAGAIVADAESGSPALSGLKEPRRLHDNSSPPLLSTYDEPIRRVVEDMREQRMSLCQSLRQYVFVHRAIIEGALMIVDEENRREAEERKQVPERAVDVDVGVDDKASGRTSSANTDRTDSGANLGHALPLPEARGPVLDGYSAAGVASGPGLGLTVGLGPSAFISSDLPGERDGEILWKRSGLEAFAENTSAGAGTGTIETIIEGVVSSPPAVSLPRSKRGASPTELTMEGLDGGVLLTKRPSVKRRHRTSDGEQFEAIALVPPGPQ